MYDQYIVSFTLHHTAFGVQERVENCPQFDRNILYSFEKIMNQWGRISPLNGAMTGGESVVLAIIDIYQGFIGKTLRVSPLLVNSPKTPHKPR